jgi:hypothetical protein
MAEGKDEDEGKDEGPPEYPGKDEAELAALMARMEATGACPNCGELMSCDAVYSATGSKRSLLQWNYCPSCNLWAAVCTRTLRPHYLATQPSELASMIVAAVGGQLAYPKFTEIENQECWANGHLCAVRLN